MKKAADEAMAKVKAENPSLSDADLMVQVSDRVKQAELARKGQAAERQDVFPYHMVGDILAHRPEFLGAAPPPIVRPQHQYVFPIPGVEEYGDPFPPDYEEEAREAVEGAILDMDPGHAELDFEIPQHRHHRLPLYPFSFPIPPGFAFDRRPQLFYHHFPQIHFDPHTARTYNFDHNVAYELHPRRYFPIWLQRHNYHYNHHPHQNPNMYH